MKSESSDDPRSSSKIISEGRLRPRKSWSEFLIEKGLLLAGAIAILFVILIFAYMLLESIPFFTQVNPVDFFFNPEYHPESPTNPRYGLLPTLWGTFFVTIMALAIAIPVGVVTAMYISQVAGRREREVLKPLIEILAGIPSVVYGFFALVVLATVLSALFGPAIVTRLNAFNGAVILAVMILPTIISISEDSLTAVPREYKEGAYALGSSDWETLRNITLPTAKPGIVTAIMLGYGRAIGETMAVLMACGGAPQIVFNPFIAILTMTAAMARDFGEVAYHSTWYHAIFAIGLVLLIITILVNWVATSLVGRKLGWRIRR